MRDVSSLEGIPGALIHGRYDVSSPLDIAWQLSKRWKTSRLAVIGDAGHGVSDSFVAAITEALSGVS